MGLALFTILGFLSQLERDLIRERVRAGMKNAKVKGVKIGRVRKRNSMLIESLLDAAICYVQDSIVAWLNTLHAAEWLLNINPKSVKKSKPIKKKN